MKPSTEYLGGKGPLWVSRSPVHLSLPLAHLTSALYYTSLLSGLNMGSQRPVTYYLSQGSNMNAI